MAGYEYFIRYEKHKQSFFLCSECGNHLALHQQRINQYEWTGLALFNDLVNIHLDEQCMVTNFPNTVTTVYCGKCRTELGIKLILLQHEEGDIRVGRFLILRNKLMYWTGTKMMYPNYSDHVEPIEYKIEFE